MSKHFQNNEDKRIKIITAVFITFANLPLEGALLAHRNADVFHRNIFSHFTLS